MERTNRIAAWQGTRRAWLAACAGAAGLGPWVQQGARAADERVEAGMRAWSQPLQTVWRSPVLRDNLGLADVTGIAWHPDGRRLAILTTFSTRMAVLEVGTDRILAETRKTSGRSADFISYAADGSQIVAPAWTTDAQVGANISFSVLDGQTLRVVRHVSGPKGSPVPGAAKVMAISGDKTRVAVVLDVRDIPSLGVFDTSNWQPVAVLTGRQYLALSLALSPDGSRLALGGFGTIRTVSLPSGAVEHTVKAYDLGVATPVIEAVLFAEQDRLVSGSAGITGVYGVDAALTTSAAHHEIMVWRARDMRLMAQSDDEALTTGGVDAHPSLPLIVTTTRHSIYFVDIRSGAIVNQISGFDTGELWSVAFSPNGAALAFGSFGRMRTVSPPST